VPAAGPGVQPRPGESRYVEEKRHFEKPIPISDLVLLDRERCILCDRCTRFADEVAGDPLISFMQRGNQTQVMTFPDEPFASYFSGNTVQICPVGALTASPYRFKARPWDLEQVESTCTTCSVGCRTVVQSSRDELVRYLGVDSDPVNWSWMCDRGSLQFEALNASTASTAPLVRGDGHGATTGERRDGAAPSRARGARGGGPGSIASSAARAAPTRTPSRGPPRTTPSVANRDAQLGDGLPAAAGAAARHHRRGRTRDTDRAARPDLRRSCRSSTCAAPRATAHVQISSSPGRPADAVRLAQRTTSRARRRPSRPRLADRRSRRPARARATSSIVAGRANLAESSAPTVAALLALERDPGAKVLPALRRGNVVGATQVGLRPARRPRHARASSTPRPTARSNASCCSAPIRSATSPTPTSPVARSPAPAASSPSTRSSPIVAAGRTSCSPRARTARSRARRPTSRAASRVGQKVTVAGTARAGLDDRRRARARAGDRLGFATVGDDHRRIDANVAGYGTSRRGARRARDGCSPSRRTIDPINEQVDHAADRNATTIRLVSAASSTTAPSARRVAVARTARAGTAVTSTARRRAHRAVAAATSGPSARRQRRARVAADERCRAARRGCRSTVTGASTSAIIDTGAVTDVRIETL
jgi:NADH-quinone oxidoreductase subunit G